MIPRSQRPFDASVLARLDAWDTPAAAVAVVDRDGLVASRGPLDVPFPWASVTKLATAYAVLAGAARGVLGLDDPAGPPGATIRHLLAHAAGYAFDDPSVIAAPGRMRVYSNAGFDELGSALASAAGRPFGVLLREWVLDPLGMDATDLVGRPSEGLSGPGKDLAAFAFELLQPRLLPASMLQEAAHVAFPGLRGILPGFGRMDPNDWGLGFEIRDGKSPHWTGSHNSPATFGHFGRTGTFLWVDPVARLAVACLTSREFGPWAVEAWPALSDAVLRSASVGQVPR